MNADFFLTALSGIDEKYVAEADVFQPAALERNPRWPRALNWAGGLTACAALLCLLAFLGKSGLFNPAEIHLQTEVLSSAAEAENAREVLSSAAETESSTAVAKDQAADRADSAAAPTPLEELPQVAFPTREEVGGLACISIACGTEPQTEELSPEEIASIWGADSLTDLAWEGLPLLESYDVTGDAVYYAYDADESGVYRIEEREPSYVSIQVRDKEKEDRLCLTLCICLEGRPLGSKIESPTRLCDVWGAEVTVAASYPENSRDAAEYQMEFDAAGDEGLHVIAWGSGTDEKAISELLTRFASQSLRPGNVFTLQNPPQKSDRTGSAPVSGTAP